jgi:hypothetical protein
MELLWHYFQGSTLPAGFKGLFELGQWLGAHFHTGEAIERRFDQAPGAP